VILGVKHGRAANSAKVGVVWHKGLVLHMVLGWVALDEDEPIPN
jgi:hypothetical protein